MDKFKNIEMKFESHEKEGHKEVITKSSAEIDLDADTSFSSIKQFLIDVKAILNEYDRCAEEGIFCKVYLSRSLYEQKGEELISHSFDYWEYSGYPERDSDGDICLYLSPDTKYTKAEWDICINTYDNVLDALAGAGL